MSRNKSHRKGGQFNFSENSPLPKPTQTGTVFTNSQNPALNNNVHGKSKRILNQRTAKK